MHSGGVLARRPWNEHRPNTCVLAASGAVTCAIRAGRVSATALTRGRSSPVLGGHRRAGPGPPEGAPHAGPRRRHHAEPRHGGKRDDLRSLKATKIGSKGLRSLAIQLKNGPSERIASQAKIQPAVKEIGKLPWQCGEPVAVEPQVLQVGELAYLGRQGGELVAADQQPAEVGELGDLGGRAVSWLPSSVRSCRLVSWPISGAARSAGCGGASVSGGW